MTTYRNDGGNHELSDGTIIGHGKEFESEDRDLCKKFPNKFTEVHKASVEVATTAPAPVDVPAEEKPVEGNPVDVTSDFKDAVDGDLKVTRDKDGWWVYDDGELIHKEALLKKNVKKTIKEYLG